MEEMQRECLKLACMQEVDAYKGMMEARLGRKQR